MTANYKLVYHGNKANLPAVRDAGSFYLTDDTRELYFGDKKYAEGVRLYTSAEGKPATPAEGVIYVNTDTGVGEVYNGSAWVVVIKGYATAIGENADDSTVPTSKAVKDYTDAKVAEVAGIVDGLGALAKKDEVSETELEATHTHANKALLDTYDQTNEDLKDAVAKKHSHANKTELDKIVEGDKANLDAVVAALTVGTF